MDITASKAALILGYNRKTIDRYFNIFREHIFEYQRQALQPFAGEIELDESYFGARRVRGKRGRGAAGKTPVFGVLKRSEQIFLTVVKAYSKNELRPIIKGQALESAAVYTDGWEAYDALILNGYEHYRVFHCQNEFTRGNVILMVLNFFGVLLNGAWLSSMEFAPTNTQILILIWAKDFFI